MKIFKKLLALLLVSSTAMTFAGCGKTEKKEEKKDEKVEQSSEKKVLNVTNTDLFIEPETIKEFEYFYHIES